MPRPHAAAVVMKVDMASLVSRLQRMDGRLIPRKIPNRLRDVAFGILIMVAQDQDLAAVDGVEKVADIFGIAAEREVSDYIEDVGSRDAVVDAADDGGIHVLDGVEGARGSAMAEDAVVTEVKIGSVKFTREGHAGILNDRRTKAATAKAVSGGYSTYLQSSHDVGVPVL